MKKRLFLESDVLKKEHLGTCQNEVETILDEKGEKYCKEVFDIILDRAWHDLDKTWKAVKAADEIYADTSLMPLSGGSYSGSPVIFNGMMERTIKEKITGKEVYILRKLKDIYWYMIDVKLMTKAFSKNKLFMYDDDNEKLIQVDIKKLVAEQKKK